jgi:hypothetical protein
MDAATLQSRIYKGFGKSALHAGYAFAVYRSSSMINPIAVGNMVIASINSVFAPSSTYRLSSYNKPEVPDWTAIVDATQMQAGDWLVGVSGTYYIADLQPLLPIPAIQCNRTISISRAGYTTVAPLEPTQTVIATNLPCFMGNKRDKESSPTSFPAPSDTKTGQPNWLFYINTRGVADIRKNDLITDENGVNYVIDVPNLTSFGYICIAHNEKP